MKCICGRCKKEVETDVFPDTWVISEHCMGTEKKETGKNPLGHGVILAFCSEDCKKKAYDKFLKEAMTIGS